MHAPGTPPTLVLRTTAPVAGGAALARDEGGRVVFVAGALAGEQVEVEVTEERKDFARGRVVRVIEPAAGRVVPPCPYVAAGCGGCDLQHADAATQRAAKQAIVVDALRRQGRLVDPVVEPGPVLPTVAFRTTVRAGVVGGRAGFRRARSHDILPVDHCLVAHPALDALLTGGDWAGADELTLRLGAATGERLVIVSPAADEVDLPADAHDAGEVRVVGTDRLAAGERAWFHDEVAGHRFRISAHSFFQSRTDGATALVQVVRALGGEELASARTVVDAYGGVGLFGVAATPPDARIVLVESGHSSVVDARHNLAGRDAKVIRTPVERWRPSPADVVIADPARTGLAKPAAAVVAGTGAGVVVLVSCDAASLGRDARLLGDAGYTLERSMLVDLFPHTHHVEVVSRFVR